MTPLSAAARSQKKRRAIQLSEQQKLHEEILALQDEEILFNEQTNELARFLQDNNDNGDEDDEEITMCQSLWPIVAVREEVVGLKKRRKNPGGGSSRATDCQSSIRQTYPESLSADSFQEAAASTTDKLS
ncbi:hypothetical protein PSTT_00408 [Puccinia striiformis]|uniref:Uncharacterized protein n=1 Tax=Puccinia striiformis TaxID=27350 RepID=A0A2S4W7K4_9BASI|nr:hypothetical protein PSTT_00408 [Puccinia striiformis]